MKLFPLIMENIAQTFVDKLKKDFPNAHWSWTGKYNNEDGYIVIWDESDVKDDFEYASPKYKMTEDGIIIRMEIPAIEGVIKEANDNYKIFRFYDQKITVAYWKGRNITSKCVAKMRPDGKYDTLYINYIKGNIFSIRNRNSMEELESTFTDKECVRKGKNISLLEH